MVQSLSMRLTQCLFHVNEEVVLEASRALGNLTRSQSVVQQLTRGRTHEALLILLLHVNFAVKQAVTGALVNLSSDVRCRDMLLERVDTIRDLTRALKKASLTHIHLSTLVCQVD